MRKQTKMGTDFQERRKVALKSVNRDIASIPGTRADYYIELIQGDIQNKILNENLAGDALLNSIAGARREIIGSLSSLVMGITKEVSNSSSFLAGDRELLLALLQLKWQEAVSKINTTKFVSTDVESVRNKDTKSPTRRKQKQADRSSVSSNSSASSSDGSMIINLSPASTVETDIQEKYHGASSLYFLNVKNKETILAHLTSGMTDPKLLERGAGEILTLIYKNERLVPNSSLSFYSKDERTLLWRFLKENDPEHKAVLWFDTGGNVTPYPDWWIKGDTPVCKIWERIADIEFNDNYRINFAARHDTVLVKQLMIWSQLENGVFHDFTTADLDKLYAFILQNIQAFVCQAKRMEEPTYSPKDILLLRSLYIKFNEASIHQDYDADKMRALHNQFNFIDKAGNFLWPDEYCRPHTNIPEIWQAEAVELGYDTLDDFLEFDNILVEPRLRPEFIHHLEQQVYGKLDVNRDELKKLEIIIRAMYLRLTSKGIILFEATRQMYFAQISAFTLVHADTHPEYVAFVETHNSHGWTDTETLDQWQHFLQTHYGNRDEFYLLELIDDELTVENYNFRSLKFKIFLAEAVIHRLNYHCQMRSTENTSIYPPAVIIEYIKILKIFLSTQFIATVYHGLNLFKLRQEAGNILSQTSHQTTVALDELTSQSSTEQEKPTPAMTVAQDDSLAQKLTLSQFVVATQPMQVDFVYLCLARLAERESDCSPATIAQRQAMMSICFYYAESSSNIPAELHSRMQAVLIHLNINGLTVQENPRSFFQITAELSQQEKWLLTIGPATLSLVKEHVKRVFQNVCRQHMDSRVAYLKGLDALQQATHDDSCADAGAGANAALPPPSLYKITKHLAGIVGDHTTSAWVAEVHCEKLAELSHSCTSREEFFESDEVLKHLEKLMRCRKQYFHTENEQLEFYIPAERYLLEFASFIVERFQEYANYSLYQSHHMTINIVINAFLGLAEDARSTICQEALPPPCSILELSQLHDKFGKFKRDTIDQLQQSSWDDRFALTANASSKIQGLVAQLKENATHHCITDKYFTLFQPVDGEKLAHKSVTQVTLV
jgi:hypothetical protein